MAEDITAGELARTFHDFRTEIRADFLRYESTLASTMAQFVLRAQYDAERASTERRLSEVEDSQRFWRRTSVTALIAPILVGLIVLWITKGH